MTDERVAPGEFAGDADEIGEDDDRLQELAELSSDAGAEFAGRVSRAIERRRLTNLGLEFTWVAPLAILREWFGMACRLSLDAFGKREGKQ
jgi:hypothetical protein